MHCTTVKAFFSRTLQIQIKKNKQNKGGGGEEEEEEEDENKKNSTTGGRWNLNPIINLGFF
jgi:hypothetical protein